MLGPSSSTKNSVVEDNEKVQLVTYKDNIRDYIISALGIKDYLKEEIVIDENIDEENHTANIMVSSKAGLYISNSHLASDLTGYKINIKDYNSGSRNNSTNSNINHYDNSNNIYSNIQNDIDINIKNSEDTSSEKTTDTVSKTADAHEILDKTLNNIIRQRPSLNKNDAINYLICLTQGYITTFAGKPGTGKTSLFNLLSNSLGLINEDNSTHRTLEIPVERNWSSHQDFIGYYNALAQHDNEKIIPSLPNVYETFDKLDKEINADSISEDIKPFLILLDEANLSAPEYYLAPFMKHCDVLYNNNIISLGGDSRIVVPNYVRFIATINNDHTTEELSPRFLDRSWVIYFDEIGDQSYDPYYDEDDDNTNNIDLYKNITETLTFKELTSLFCLDTATQKNNDSETSKRLNANRHEFDMILAVCHLLEKSVSPRSQKMIWEYLKTGVKYMDGKDPNSKNYYLPLDYAVSQKILPTIKGFGASTELLLHALAGDIIDENHPYFNNTYERKYKYQIAEDEVITNSYNYINNIAENIRELHKDNKLPLIARHTKRMLAQGSNDNYYQFF